jgi:glycosyltransferase involved in cell wall biosynthesis
MRLCIAFLKAPGYSQTFVTDHIENLPFEKLVVQGVPLPFRDLSGRRVPGVPPMRKPPDRLPPNVRRWLLRLQAEAHALAVAAHLRRHHVDVVLAEFGTTGVAMLNVCRRARLPLVVHFHGFDAYRSDLLQLYRKSYPDLFELARALVVVSTHMERQLTELGAPPERLHRIVYGVDLARFCGAEPARVGPHWVAVGRLVEKKGPLLTLRAFAQVADRVPAATLTLAGDGPLLEPARELVARLGLSDRVRLPGALGPDSVAELLRRARGFVQHSLRAPDGDHEGTPVAILEAQASGLPVVATRHGGIPDVVVEGVTGALVEEGDLEAMSEAMLRLSRDADLAARWGAAGRERVASEFTAEGARRRLSELLVESSRTAAPDSQLGFGSSPRSR